MKLLRKTTALLLCLMLLLLPCAARAEETEAVPEEGETFTGEDVTAPEEEPFTVIREEEIKEIINDYLLKNRIYYGSIGIGFLYTETGEEWYYDGDRAFYSASLYKVPLLMCVSNMVARGELEQDAVIEGRTLTTMEEAILTVSNNSYAHILINHFWPDNRDCRALWPAMAGMELSEMPRSFLKTSEFTARFMTRLMYTLYSDPESYPMVIDYLKQATPEQFFRYRLEGQYEIAQKFGEFEEYRHVSGIIYTEHPIIVTYLTKNVRAHGAFSADLAVRLVEYAKILDERLEAHEEELRLEREAEEERLRQEAEAAAAAEAAARAAEEAEAARAAEEAARLRAEAEAEAARTERKREALLIGAAVAVGGGSVLAALARRGSRTRKGGKKR